MRDDVKQAIRAFIIENFLFGDAAGVPGDQDSLLAGGIIDSTAVLELVGFIEEHFGIAVADADIVPANLDSIQAIAGFVTRKSAPALAS